MKKIVFFPVLFLSLVVYSTGEGKNNEVSQGEQSEVSIEDPTNSQETLEAEVSQYATIAQLDSLHNDLTSLIDKVEKTPSPGNSLFNALVSLLLGVAGGVGAFIFLEKKKSLKKNHDSESILPAPLPSGNRNEMFNSNTNPSLVQTKQQEMERKSNQKSGISSSSEVNSIPPQSNQRQDVITRKDYMRQPSNPTQSKEGKVDVKKIVFGNISIPTKDMLIVTEDNLTEKENGKNFQFDLNETRGIGTYTFAPNVMNDAINRLSALEPFVEPFEFSSSAKRVEIKRPGKLVNKDGYWLVESKIIISLS